MDEVGQRIELICCTDKYSDLKPGDKGTIIMVDSLGTVHVDWDNGSNLGLVREGGDRWKPAEE